MKRKGKTEKQRLLKLNLGLAGGSVAAQGRGLNECQANHLFLCRA